MEESNMLQPRLTTAPSAPVFNMTIKRAVGRRSPKPPSVQYLPEEQLAMWANRVLVRECFRNRMQYGRPTIEMTCSHGKVVLRHATGILIEEMLVADIARFRFTMDEHVLLSTVSVPVVVPKEAVAAVAAAINK